MQSGKRLTLKVYFAKHILVHTRIIKIQMLNCYCQLSSSVIFRQICVSQSECKIDRPRPGLSRLSPRPHMKALGTRLKKTYSFSKFTCFFHEYGSREALDENFFSLEFWL